MDSRECGVCGLSLSAVSDSVHVEVCGEVARAREGARRVEAADGLVAQLRAQLEHVAARAVEDAEGARAERQRMHAWCSAVLSDPAVRRAIWGESAGVRAAVEAMLGVDASVAMQAAACVVELRSADERHRRYDNASAKPVSPRRRA